MGEKNRGEASGSGRKRPEPDRTVREPGELVARPEDPGEEHEYPPGKARLLDEEDKLASQSDDEPGLE
jgi:hypothetical protein